MNTSVDSRRRDGATGLIVAAMASGGVWAQEKFRIAGNFTDEHSSSIAIEQFKKDVEAATGGKLVIEMFPNQQLGGAQENVTQTRAGTIDMTWVGMAFLSRTVPELEAVSLPFMFPSREVAYKVMDGTDRRPASTRSWPTRASSRSASWNSVCAR